MKDREFIRIDNNGNIISIIKTNNPKTLLSNLIDLESLKNDPNIENLKNNIRDFRIDVDKKKIVKLKENEKKSIVRIDGYTQNLSINDINI